MVQLSRLTAWLRSRIAGAPDPEHQRYVYDAGIRPETRTKTLTRWRLTQQRGVADMAQSKVPTIGLGDVAKDMVTGFIGTCVARTEWLNGCWRLVLQGKVDKDGKVPDAVQFDAEQCELVRRKDEALPAGQKDTGGPRPNVTPQGHGL